MAREAATPHRFGDKPYLGFEHVTMVPMCRKLIDATLLTEKEKQWLNSYHREVVEKVRDFFKGEDGGRTMRWVERETAAI
jgi:Xaa-Pro aminopeptidase